MRLNALKKLRATLREKLSLGTITSRVWSDEPNKANEPKEATAIVLKERRRSVLIRCWHDGKEMWVMKGSHCHQVGLCSRCIDHFDAATGTVKT